MKKKILIVENEALVAEEIRLRLRNLGYDVPDIVASGEQAVNQAVKINPDLILMDIKLDGIMDGVDAAEKIRDKCKIPIIYLTAYADDKTLKRAKITVPYAYILKPFAERELHSAVEFALYKHQVEKEEFIEELENALERVKTLSGLVLICAACKNVRKDDGHWQQIEAYIRDRSEVQFSHSICPECMKKLYSEYAGNED